MFNRYFYMNQKKNTECWYLWIIGCGAIDTKVRTDTQSIEVLFYFFIYRWLERKSFIIWNIFLFSRTRNHLNFEQQKSWSYHHLCTFQSFTFSSKVSPTDVLRIIQSWRCIQAIQICCMASIIPPSTMIELWTATPVCVIIMILCGKHHLIMITELVT